MVFVNLNKNIYYNIKYKIDGCAVSLFEDIRQKNTLHHFRKDDLYIFSVYETDKNNNFKSANIGFQKRSNSTPVTQKTIDYITSLKR